MRLWSLSGMVFMRTDFIQQRDPGDENDFKNELRKLVLEIWEEIIDEDIKRTCESELPTNDSKHNNSRL